LVGRQALEVRLKHEQSHHVSAKLRSACRSTSGTESLERAWLDRSLLAINVVESIADRGVRALHKFMFPEALTALAEAEEELSMNTAMQDLYSRGPLSRARRQHAAATAHGAPHLSPVPTW
jgi:hypothetical protein